MITISSQRYIDEDIVEAKQGAADYEVFVSPSFEVDGLVLRVVLDGHHSLAAALENDEEPVFTEYDSTEHDAICLLEAGDVEGFLQVTHMGDDYYNIETGKDVW
ncbi:hypothetical protein ACDI10_09785 [Vreelandella venusta]|uniref:hypothetical protein n=1 Tax=Vreelandella venusta TaxID=44935 RepID=UPI003556F52F